jgi:hypothetical protein
MVKVVGKIRSPLFSLQNAAWKSYLPTSKGCHMKNKRPVYKTALNFTFDIALNTVPTALDEFHFV